MNSPKNWTNYLFRRPFSCWSCNGKLARSFDGGDSAQSVYRQDPGAANVEAAELAGISGCVSVCIIIGEERHHVLLGRLAFALILGKADLRPDWIEIGAGYRDCIKDSPVHNGVGTPIVEHFVHAILHHLAKS